MVGSEKIVFQIEGVGKAKGELKRFLSPKTVDAIIRNLPIKGRAAQWEEEIYFETPVKLGLEKSKSTVKVGDIAYWPLGSALCVFYGKTQPYSPVNLIGEITEELNLFHEIKIGTFITVNRDLQ